MEDNCWKERLKKLLDELQEGGSFGTTLSDLGIEDIVELGKILQQAQYDQPRLNVNFDDGLLMAKIPAITWVDLPPNDSRHVRRNGEWVSASLDEWQQVIHCASQAIRQLQSGLVWLGFKPTLAQWLEICHITRLEGFPPNAVIRLDGQHVRVFRPTDNPN